MKLKICIFPDSLVPAGDVVYPLRLLLNEDGGVIEAAPAFADAAEALAARLAYTAQSPGQIMLDMLSPRMRQAGYAPLPHAERTIVCLTAIDPVAPPRPDLLCAYRDTAGLRWALSHARAHLPDDAVTVVEAGTVAAAAWYTEEGIAVETAPAYRRRGYAHTAAAALIAARRQSGREVIYRCAETNTASMALAASLGLQPTARLWRPGFRRMAAGENLTKLNEE